MAPGQPHRIRAGAAGAATATHNPTSWDGGSPSPHHLEGILRDGKRNYNAPVNKMLLHTWGMSGGGGGLTCTLGSHTEPEGSMSVKV